MSIHRLASAICILGPFAVASTAPAVVQSTSWGVAAPPATIGGYSMQAFGLDPRSLLGDVTGIEVAHGSPFGTVTFSIPLNHRRIGNGWNTWSNGYTGDVYASLGNGAVTIALEPGTTAFSLYVEPNAYGLHSCIVTCGNATISSVVEGNSGALGLGFYTTDGSDLPSIIVSFSQSASGFAIGQFASAAPDSDGDGFPNSIDNCPNVANPDQADCDATGLGDACSPDCDADGLPDACALAGGAADVNANGIPDTCDCPADINQSGTIDAEDLAYVLFAWGMPGSKAGGADINGDAIVDANDLSLVLGSWGACPD